MTARRIGLTLLVLAIAGAAIYAAYWYKHRQAATAATAGGGTEPEITPVATVEAVAVREGSIDITATAFGTVEAALGETQTFSVPFESRVLRVLVVRGQHIQPNDPLVEIEPSPDTMLQLDQARQKLDSAKSRLKLVRQKMKLQLATREDLLAAQDAVSAAELELRSLKERGIGERKMIHAAVQGVASKVDVEEGQIVPAGAAMVEMIGQNQIVVRVGVESEDVYLMHAGQKVTIEPINGSAEIFDGKILRITREVNPETRLVNVYIAPASGSRLLLNEYVRSRITVETRRGLLVPSRSVIPEANAYVLYTITDGHAVKHEVTLGPTSDGQILVAGEGLQAGLQVVTVGVSQLEDGMAVKVSPAK